jgi:hypothetical protein
MIPEIEQHDWHCRGRFLSAVNHKVIAGMHSDRTFGIYERQSKRNAS